MFGLFGLFTGRGGNRQMLAARIALIAVLLVATLVFHVSGTALVILKVVRIALVLGLLVVGRRISRTRAQETHHLDP